MCVGVCVCVCVCVCGEIISSVDTFKCAQACSKVLNAVVGSHGICACKMHTTNVFLELHRCLMSQEGHEQFLS